MKKVFRVFISSTFGDLEAERDALHRHVFPQLERLCAEHQCEFQAIDLRWGVREEAALSQETMRICLNEIARAQSVTPRPNFLVLLGERYGWQPLPASIPAREFMDIMACLPPAERALFEGANGWYRLDENALPPVYVLRPRAGVDDATWQDIERSMHAVLERARLSEAQRLKFIASATHQEIAAGLFGTQNAARSVFCFARVLSRLPAKPATLAPALRRYLDDDGTGMWDLQAHAQLCALRQRLQDTLGSHFHCFDAAWTGDGITADHLGSLPKDVLKAEKEDGFKSGTATLCEAAWTALSGAIREELEQISQVDPADAEDELHLAFGRARSANYVGHGALQSHLLDYARPPGLLGALSRRFSPGVDTSRPLLLAGPTGVGKTAFLAELANRLRAGGTRVLVRFVAATAASTDVVQLLSGLCRQLVAQLGLEGDDAKVPGEMAALSQMFRRLLQQKECVIIIDALDQLAVAEKAGGFNWIPGELPAHTRIVLSSLPCRALNELQRTLPQANVVELPPLQLGDAETLLAEWLKTAGRRVTPEQAGLILEGYTACPRPLYLKLACQQAAHWKSFDRPAPLEPTTDALIEGMLRRLAEDEHHGRTLVERALGYLACARFGLAEKEILEVLARDAGVYAHFLASARHIPPDLTPHVEEHLQLQGSDYSPERWLRSLDVAGAEAFVEELFQRDIKLSLPYAVWSRLYYELLPFLTERLSEGQPVFSFYHQSIAATVRRLFVESGDGDVLHTRLADYFDSRRDDLSLLIAAYAIAQLAMNDPARRIQSRILAELPWQLVWAGAWTRLNRLLASESMLHAIYSRSRFEARELWARLEDNAHILLKDTYAGVIDNPDKHPLIMDTVLSLLSNRGGYEQEIIRMSEAAGRTADEGTRLGAMLRKAAAHIAAGEYEEGLDLARQAEEGARAHGSQSLECDALYLQSEVYFYTDNTDAALDAVARQEHIERDLGDIERINQCLKWKAAILKKMDRVPEALVLYDELLRYYEQSDNKDGLVACLFELATATYVTMQDFDTAFAYFEQAEKLLLEMGQRRWLMLLYVTGAHMYGGVNMHAKTVECYDKYLALRGEIGEDDTLLAHEAAEYAKALVKSGEKEKALSVCSRYEPTVRGPENRDAESLKTLVTAHLVALRDLMEEWRSTMPYREYRVYQDQFSELYNEYQLLEREVESTPPDPADAAAHAYAQKISERAANWKPPS